MRDKYILWAPRSHIELAMEVYADTPSMEKLADEMMYNVEEDEVFLYKLVPVRKYERLTGVKVTEIKEVWNESE